MLSFKMALANAKATKADWNNEEYTSKAIITWADSEWEHELVVENEDMDGDFETWVENNAVGLASEDADEKGTIFEEIVGIRYEYDTIDDDALFENDYMAYAENEWELCTGR